VSGLLDRPYADRQRIVVVSGEASGTDWPALARRAIGTAVSPTVAAVRQAAAAIAPAPALAVARADLAGVVLPPGHPREGVVYVGNPVDPPLYYPAAQFHRLTFEHKLAEAVRLLVALGATELEVRHVAGWSREVAGRIHVPIPSKGMVVGGDGDERSSSSSALLFRATLDGGDPWLPDDLGWYPHEPTWRQVADARMRHGLRDFELAVRYVDDFGVNGSLSVAAQKFGVSLGGAFEEHRSTEWRITGTF
jgi:hypothetical protein